MSEFDLINQFFKTTIVKRNDVLLGIGDDCAILAPPANKTLAVSTDTLISGVHFPESTCAEDIGYKSLAVNLSDLAAMGAEPAWASLAISLPEANKSWLQGFMQGFNELAEKHNVSLIGGDTTQGPLSVTINITGFVDSNTALKRSNAKAGDAIFVTGNIGDAFIGLDTILNKSKSDQKPSGFFIDYCIKRLNRPQPRLKAGQLLTAFPVAAIDISDGLMADLNHICKASGVGAKLKIDKLPLSAELMHYYNKNPDWQRILSAGDDYELCFTCPENKLSEMKQLMRSHEIDITCIGEITASPGIKCFLNNEIQSFKLAGYNHF